MRIISSKLNGSGVYHTRTFRKPFEVENQKNDFMFPDDKVYVLHVTSGQPKGCARVQVRLWKAHTSNIIPIAIEKLSGDDANLLLISIGQVLEDFELAIYQHFRIP